MRIPSLRGHGLGPRSLLDRARRRVKPREVSRERLLEVRRRAGERVPALPSDPPRSVAVVVPCFGHAPFLPAAIESLLAQTRPPDEIVFVDDCSPDATGEILSRLLADPGSLEGRIRVLVNDRNLGQSASLNRGVGATSADLVMVLNDDDYLMHDAVERALELFREHPGIALLGANHVRFAGDDELATAPKRSSDYPGFGDPLTIVGPAAALGYRLADDLPMTHSAMSFRRQAWTVVGGYFTGPGQRVVPSTDRDFQMRVNALWPVGVARRGCLSFWRTDSSVDAGRFT